MSKQEEKFNVTVTQNKTYSKLLPNIDDPKKDFKNRPNEIFGFFSSTYKEEAASEPLEKVLNLMNDTKLST